MKIYTRTGDQGTTSLYTGERVAKSDPIVEAMGSVDECNCCIGMAVAAMEPIAALKEAHTQLETIQHALFDVGAALATPRTRASSVKLEKTRFGKEATAHLESWIDSMELELTPLHTFILPGGDPVGAFLHLARSVCRRAERVVVPLQQEGDISASVLIYLNRLSDYLFVLSRYVNLKLGHPETFWQPHKEDEN